MTWYYTREEGEEGQVLTDEGVPSGVRLTDLLENGPLPMGVVLEFVAYLADILTIAEEDQAMHGDISPGDVFIDEKGAVSLSNYGPMRTQGRAPEGRPLFPASDVYGLGVVLHAALSTQSLGAIPRQRDAHDDAIVDHLIAIDWSALERLPGRDSLIHFLCSMLAHDPGERPAPLDVANVLAGAGDKISGAGVTTWAKSRWGGSGAIESELPTVSEVLAAPESMGLHRDRPGSADAEHPERGGVSGWGKRPDDGSRALGRPQLAPQQRLVARAGRLASLGRVSRGLIGTGAPRAEGAREGGALGPCRERTRESRTHTLVLLSAHTQLLLRSPPQTSLIEGKPVSLDAPCFLYLEQPELLHQCRRVPPAMQRCKQPSPRGPC